MKAYLLSLLGTAFATALVNLLCPDRSQRYMKFMTSMLFLCVLASPLPQILHAAEELVSNGDSLFDPPSTEQSPSRNDYLDEASKTYFVQHLTHLLETELQIPAGEVRCAVLWEEEDGIATPVRVTVILSGSSIWKDPNRIEATVSALLGCECVTAIE